MNLRCLTLGHRWQKIWLSAVCTRCRRVANHVATDEWYMPTFTIRLEEDR